MSTLKPQLFRALAVFAVLVLASPAMASYIEHFSTDSASWNYGYGTGFTLGTTTWSATGGNPDGHISGDSSNLYAVWTYDTAAYGDMTDLTLTVDTKITDSETGTAQFYVGYDGSYFIDGSWDISGDTDWTTHTTVLDSAHFTPWTGVNNNAHTLADVLQTPDDIGIFFGGGVASGSGSLLVDNYGTAAAVPEPVSAALVSTALLGFFVVRRRRRG